MQTSPVNLQYVLLVIIQFCFVLFHFFICKVKQQAMAKERDLMSTSLFCQMTTKAISEPRTLPKSHTWQKGYKNLTCFATLLQREAGSETEHSGLKLICQHMMPRLQTLTCCVPRHLIIKHLVLCLLNCYLLSNRYYIILPDLAS